MPTYAYRCSACDHEFEAVQSFHDDPLTVCPKCGTSAAKRVFRSVGVIFKGSGWYVNDTRSDRGRGGRATEPAGASSAAAPGEPAAADGSAGESAPAASGGGEETAKAAESAAAPSTGDKTSPADGGTKAAKAATKG